MDTTTKRPRGRPRGSSRLNEADWAFLAKAANLVTADPTLQPTTAFRRLAPQATGAEIHRWQEKWREARDRLLAEARQRHDEAKLRTARARDVTLPPPPAGIAAELARLGVPSIAGDVARSRAVLEAISVLPSPMLRAAMDQIASPGARAAMGIAKSPAARAALGFIDNERMQATVEVLSPMTAATRAFLDSPQGRLMQEERKAWERHKMLMGEFPPPRLPKLP